MSKRAVKIMIPEGDYADLKAIAEGRGNDASSYAAWLVISHVDNERRSGKIPHQNDSAETLDRLRAFFDDVARGEYHTDLDIAKLAADVDFDTSHLLAHQNCYKKGMVKNGI
jgi:hypothetical protein